jgi:lysophospholipase L1-like esterase
MKPLRDMAVTEQGFLLSRRKAALLIGASLLINPAGAFAESVALTDETIARSQLSRGDLGRLRRVFAKARRGEPITLGVIGGSITFGAFSTSPENSYAGRLLGWWRERFPQCDVRLINAGVGGTGSMYGAIRADKDLLSSQPDLVVIEFAVNDNWTDGEAFEGLVRQVLAQPNSPAALLLFMMWEKGGNDQEMQSKVGAHYQLPMVSFRDALWPEMQADRVNWSEYIVDNVHPNDAGHAAAARLVTRMFDTAIDTAVGGDSGSPSPLPPPLYSDAFQHVDWRDAATLDPIDNNGWLLLSDANNVSTWNGSKPGRISFDWTGSGVVAVFAEAPRDLRDVLFSIDGAALQTLDVLKQPKRQLFVLAHDLAPGRHTVAFSCANGQRTGAATAVRLLGLASIGTTSDRA